MDRMDYEDEGSTSNSGELYDPGKVKYRKLADEAESEVYLYDPAKVDYRKLAAAAEMQAMERMFKKSAVALTVDLVANVDLVPRTYTEASYPVRAKARTKDPKGKRAPKAPHRELVNVVYECADCGTDVELNYQDAVQCRECGYRILYKKRTKKSVQYDTR
ncbi:hypothetical protein R1flu_013520 [Riccia fluitans]|uniref:Uncharacterized protein n=1 Tax=Riccia fluitans TaxID=41844 RepID=A0ABD1YDH3_9MARC